MTYATREEADREARERSAVAGVRHVVVRAGAQWTLRRTNLPAQRSDELLPGRGEPGEAPADERNFLMRQLPPYGAG